MLILAIETTGDLCSIAVADDQGTLVERAFRHRMHLSERLIDDVDATLRDAEARLGDVDGLAVDVGPGSFTGIRVGVMTVKTWADVLGKPVVGVNALETLAEAYSGVGAAAIVPLVRARPGAVYRGIYRPATGGIVPVADPQISSLSEVAATVAKHGVGPVLVCGDGLVRSRHELEAALMERGITAFIGHAEAPRAADVARIGRRRITSGQVDSALALAPFYIAPPPVDPRAEQRMKG